MAEEVISLSEQMISSELKSNLMPTTTIIVNAMDLNIFGMCQHI